MPGRAAHADRATARFGTLSGGHDLSGLTGTLENGNSADILGGMGSGLAWAGGSTFLALPDRGPNAVAYTNSTAVDNTTSYIARFNTVNVNMASTPSAVPSGTVPYTITPTLQSTTLLYSTTALNYGPATPSLNSTDKYYFSGRSDNFATGLPLEVMIISSPACTCFNRRERWVLASKTLICCMVTPRANCS